MKKIYTLARILEKKKENSTDAASSKIHRKLCSWNIQEESKDNSMDKTQVEER